MFERNKERTLGGNNSNSRHGNDEGIALYQQPTVHRERTEGIQTVKAPEELSQSAAATYGSPGEGELQRIISSARIE